MFIAQARVLLQLPGAYPTTTATRTIWGTSSPRSNSVAQRLADMPSKMAATPPHKGYTGPSGRKPPQHPTQPLTLSLRTKEQVIHPPEQCAG